MTVWHWVRHGPTHEKAFVGWRDVPADLSDVASIARLRAHLPKEAVVVSSDLVRASATADAIQSETHHRLPHDPDLREFNFGDWDGLHFSAVSSRDPETSRAYWENPGETSPPGGESWNAAARRINAAVDRICVAHPDKHIIAVAHIGVILTQIQRALDVPPQAALSHMIENFSVTEIHWKTEPPSVPRINHKP
jgi:broad specificity phosphatase PhoE